MIIILKIVAVSLDSRYEGVFFLFFQNWNYLNYSELFPSDSTLWNSSNRNCIIWRYFWQKKHSDTSADGKKRGKRWRAELLHGSPRSVWQRVKISGQWYWGSVYGGSRPVADLAFWIWPILQRSKLQSRRAAGFHPNLLYKLTFRWEPIW